MNKIDLINYLIKRYDYKSYLEIGCYKNECFDNIVCENKIGVDPYSGGNVRMSSDKFFLLNKLKIFNRKKFDIILIDGLHYSVQVCRDIKNSLKCLNNDGTIIIHDCHPLNEEEATYPDKGTKNWNGDVWKALVQYRQKPELDIITADFDWGCGIIKVRQNTDKINLDKKYTELTWIEYIENKDKWLRLKSFEEIKNWL
ncbi:MAG: class I SAM-dependent methyltransferase [Bacteroidales bacterium]|nr:class I SAM-dependent methyltransferase [Bacteroidales bacterium]